MTPRFPQNECRPRRAAAARRLSLRALTAVALLLAGVPATTAAPWRDWWRERRAARQLAQEHATVERELPAGIAVLRDLMDSPQERER